MRGSGQVVGLRWLPGAHDGLLRMRMEDSAERGWERVLVRGGGGKQEFKWEGVGEEVGWGCILIRFGFSSLKVQKMLPKFCTQPLLRHQLLQTR